MICVQESVLKAQGKLLKNPSEDIKTIAVWFFALDLTGSSAGTSERNESEMRLRREQLRKSFERQIPAGQNSDNFLAGQLIAELDCSGK